uniref:Uncharacterized protein n=1 Tax=Grammatophora oceanica TaxID=210454 RepID=A0A7S1YEW5_9STRA|mmetsp:Transcript_46935/g.69803  ORF Transcript_46935/g.69803 Transcript_46935/m.69803 type:complete len:278 (+) Transcript_46935:179-1012(+)|eukprot:CAMPEP_0194048428 /NCGR_PEP_ID=MMETSP0009_2-20130614/27261_1 /TAXON_ID=210454 /ORGANISM="Grammatophora oceanica, Strain CCMP 410" /LENGTH=277 /DNA_ID=CAMNT_0038694283 /DNA_START=177 /DNA_END=1010 /DNA_ORIENTATION=+
MAKASNYQSINEIDEFEWSLSLSTIDEDDCVSPTRTRTGEQTGSRRRAPTPVVIAIAVSQILLVAMLLLGWSSGSVSSSMEDDVLQSGDVEMLGSSRNGDDSSPLSDGPVPAAHRILDDSAFVDMEVACEDAFSDAAFRDYVAFQNAMGTHSAVEVSPSIYQVHYHNAGANVTLFVDYDDDKLELNAEIVGRQFDFFETYHETIAFVPLPATESPNGARRVQDDQQTTPSDKIAGNDGCRVFHTFAAIFSPQAPVTEEQWHEASDRALLLLRDLVEP